MGDAGKGQVSSAAAEVYDRFFVPALFGAWAPVLVDAAQVGDGQRVLDVACGTGIVARAARERMRGGSVVGVDVNDGMLAVARRRAPGIEWRRARAEKLPFRTAGFDRVLCQFGLMFFEDRDAAAAEMLRVLRPGGLCAVAVWASLAETPGYAAMTGLLDRLFGSAVGDALRAPYGLHDPRQLAAPFAGCGLGEIEVRTIPGKARYPSIDEWVRMDVKGWTLAEMIDDDAYDRLRAEARSELARFTQADGSVSFDAPARVLVCRRPG